MRSVYASSLKGYCTPDMLWRFLRDGAAALQAAHADGKALGAIDLNAVAVQDDHFLFLQPRRPARPTMMSGRLHPPYLHSRRDSSSSRERRRRPKHLFPPCILRSSNASAICSGSPSPSARKTDRARSACSMRRKRPYRISPSDIARSGPASRKRAKLSSPISIGIGRRLFLHSCYA